jgi:hypothetical protein
MLGERQTMLMPCVALRCIDRPCRGAPRSSLAAVLVMAMAMLVVMGRAAPLLAAELCWTPAQLAGAWHPIGTV